MQQHVAETKSQDETTRENVTVHAEATAPIVQRGTCHVAANCPCYKFLLLITRWQFVAANVTVRCFCNTSCRVLSPQCS